MARNTLCDPVIYFTLGFITGKHRYHESVPLVPMRGSMDFVILAALNALSCSTLIVSSGANDDNVSESEVG